MKTATLVTVTLLFTLSGASANSSEMERRLQEQERQIARLETQNSQLRWLIHRRGIEIDDPSLLHPESKSHPEAPGSDARTHFVKKGESLGEIARQAGTTPEHLATLNKLQNPQLIQIGQRLRLPAVKALPDQPAVAPASKPATHIVAPGENLYRIAIKYRMPLDQLLNNNPGVDPHTLRIGQELQVATHPEQATESTGAEASPVS
jgi:LysM repeat protein